MTNDVSAKERILREAKQLFAQNGLHQTTLRQIADASGIGINLISYHFKTKDDLQKQVLSLDAPSINERRKKLLEDLEFRYSPNIPPVDEIIATLISPIFEVKKENPDEFSNFVRIFHREVGSPTWQEGVGPYLFPLFNQYALILNKALPTARRSDIVLGLAIAFSSLALADGSEARSRIGPGLAKVWNEEDLEDRLIRAVSATIKALA